MRAVIFDFDGLMVDSEPLHYQSEKELFNSYGIEFPPTLFAKGEGLSVADTFEMYQKYLHFSIPTDELLKKKYEIFLSFVDKELTLMPGVMELLSFFDDRRILYAIGTSGTIEYVSRALAKFSLGKRFAGRVVTVDQVARGKPAPDVFVAAARTINTDPSMCLVLEDSENGVRAAIAAGMQMVHVSTNPLVARDLSYVPHVASLLELIA